MLRSCHPIRHAALSQAVSSFNWISFVKPLILLLETTPEITRHLQTNISRHTRHDLGLYRLYAPAGTSQ